MTKNPREIRDPIHGFIQRSDLERKLIDTSAFQRLRRIRQLAMAQLVYPGALHTRFDHSVGVMHVAGRMADRCGLDSERQQLVRAAALLHDIGHGPFSHVSEDVLERYPNRDKYSPVKGSKIAEVIAWRIIEGDTEIAKYLSQDTTRELVGLLRASRGSSAEQQILSGPLDGDKQDYLLRDSYFCGVKYGVFDIERLIGSIGIDSSNSDEILVVPREGLYAVEQFVMAKYHMTWQVYRHKIRLISDNMIVRALQLGIEVDQLDWLNKLYRYDGSDEFLVNYLQWDDARVLNQLLHYDAKKGTCAALFDRLQRRDLFKVVFSEELSRLQPPAARNWLSQLKNNESACRELENEIAGLMTKVIEKTVSREHVILNQFSMKSVREQARNKDLSIVVKERDGFEEFDQASQLFHSINAKESALILEVYAPLDIEDANERRKKKIKLSDEIRKLLIEFANARLKTEPEKKEKKDANQ